MHSETIRTIRTILGLTQDELAIYLDVGRQSVYRWELPEDAPGHVAPPHVVMLIMDGLLRALIAGFSPEVIRYHVLGMLDEI